jgi:hypothetical protein
MNELLASVSQLVDYIQSNGGNFNTEAQREISEFLSEVNQFIESYQEEPSIETNIPPNVGQIWNLSGGNEQAFTDYLRQIPDPALNSLLTNPTQLRSIIRRLQENQPQERSREVEGIPQAPLQSSNIWGMAYDQRNRKAYVKFQGDGVYEYDGIPPMIFELFRRGSVPAKTNGQNQFGKWWKGKNPSLGAAFFELIRNGGYPYQKIS